MLEYGRNSVRRRSRILCAALLLAHETTQDLVIHALPYRRENHVVERRRAPVWVVFEVMAHLRGRGRARARVGAMQLRVRVRVRVRFRCGVG